MRKNIYTLSVVLLLFQSSAAEYQFVSAAPRLAGPERMKLGTVAVVASREPAQYGFQKSKGRTGYGVVGAISGITRKVAPEALAESEAEFTGGLVEMAAQSKMREQLLKVAREKIGRALVIREEVPLALDDYGSLRADGVDAVDYLILARPLSNGYLYVFQVDSLGKLEWVFPRNPSSTNSAGSNPVKSQQTIRIPPAESKRVLYLDRTAGIEHLYAVFSATEWPEMEKTLANPAPVSSQTGSATRLATVQGPNGLKLRGVGGTRINSAPAALGEAFAAEWADEGKTYKLPFSNVVLESNGSFLVVERWFKHINPP